MCLVREDTVESPELSSGLLAEPRFVPCVLCDSTEGSNLILKVFLNETAEVFQAYLFFRGGGFQPRLDTGYAYSVLLCSIILCHAEVYVGNDGGYLFGAVRHVTPPGRAGRPAASSLLGSVSRLASQCLALVAFAVRGWDVRVVGAPRPVSEDSVVSRSQLRVRRVARGASVVGGHLTSPGCRAHSSARSAERWPRAGPAEPTTSTASFSASSSPGPLRRRPSPSGPRWHRRVAGAGTSGIRGRRVRVHRRRTPQNCRTSRFRGRECRPSSGALRGC